MFLTNGVNVGSRWGSKFDAYLQPDFRYEPGMTTASEDFVMAHGRYTGWGPKPMVAVDIFRVENGKVAEHSDVMQEEVPAEQTTSGNPMF